MEPKPNTVQPLQNVKQGESETGHQNEGTNALQIVEQPKLMELNIKSLVGKQIHKIAVPESSTVGYLKNQIESRYKINFRHQSLIFGDRVLADFEKLNYCKLTDGCTLLVVPKMRTGPLDFKVDAKALEKFVKQIDSRINQICEIMKNKSNAPLTNKDMAVLVSQPDGSYNIVIVNAENQQRTIAEPGTNDDVIKNESNDKTRDKMVELRKKMNESKERRQKKKHKHGSQSNEEFIHEHVPLEFVDAEAIIDEKDWNKLVRIMAENRNHKSKAADQKKETPVGTKNDERKMKQNKTKVNGEQNLKETDENRFGERVAFENDKIKVAEPNKEFSLGPSSTDEILGENSESDDNSERECSEFEDFFDCQEIESDNDGLWKGFVVWLYQSVFHYKLKYLSENPE